MMMLSLSTTIITTTCRQHRPSNRHFVSNPLRVPHPTNPSGRLQVGRVGVGRCPRHTSSTSFSCSSNGSTHRSTIFHWYADCLERYPIVTKSITSGIISGTGDCVCQGLTKTMLEEQNSNSRDGARSSVNGWDGWRTARFAILGLVLAGPGCHYWYGGLNRWFPGSSMLVVSQRVMADQLIFNPPFLFLWLTSFWCMEDIHQFANLQEYYHKMKEHFPNIILANWMWWIPAQALTFRFVPISFQVLASDCFDFLWSTYLSFTTSEMNIMVQQDDTDTTTVDDESSLSSLLPCGK